jgi:hypothetical protein
MGLEMHKIRKWLLLSWFCVCAQLTLGQKGVSKIDRVHSAADVETIIHALDKRYEKFTCKPIAACKRNFGDRDDYKKIADSLGITQPFYKADFDQNGYTDLLAIGEDYHFAILIVWGDRHDSLKLNRLTRRPFQWCTYPKIVNDSIIRYYSTRPRATGALDAVNLIFKYGDFIEYNPHPANYPIEKIEYQTTMCFGTCPQFSLVINNNKSAVFEAEQDNRPSGNAEEITGTFTTVIDDRAYKEIIDLLRYIDFPHLKDAYTVDWTDDQTCTLTVTYGNGRVKTITDYGLIGTYGLDRLYQLLFELRFNQDWKK